MALFLYMHLKIFVRSLLSVVLIFGHDLSIAFNDLGSSEFMKYYRPVAGSEHDDNDYESSAEAIASSLLRHFAAVHRPRSSADIEWLVSYAQAPQMVVLKFLLHVLFFFEPFFSLFKACA